MQIGVITNPNSKKNYRHPNRRRSLEQAVGAHGVVRETRSLDELPTVIAELLDAGCEHWVCDGGDGTLHWVLNSLYAAVRARTPAGQPLDIPVIDTCRVHGARDGADDFDRVGLAAALGGVASAFFDRFYALPKERGAFAIASVIGAAAGSALVHSLAPPLRRFLPADTSEFFRPTRARVEVDGRLLGRMTAERLDAALAVTSEGRS